MGRVLQTRLNVTQPGDQCELEAERVSAAILSKPEFQPAVARACDCEAIRSATPGSHEIREIGADEDLRPARSASPEDSLGGDLGYDLDAFIGTLPGRGARLEGPLRVDFERRFGRDFGGVQIHTDGAAATSAQSIAARAYAIGRHVVFGAGQYQPHSSAGRALLAHELVHVVQQGEAPEKAMGTTSPRVASPVAVARRGLELAGYWHTPEPSGGCGVCFGSARLAGTAAHRVLQEQFEQEHGYAGIYEYPLRFRGRKLRVDLVHRDDEAKIFEIGEIKPDSASQLADGKRQLQRYEEALKLANPGWTVRRMTGRLKPALLPSGYSSRLVAGPDCPAQTIYTREPDEGVYLYLCFPPASVLRVDPRCKCGKRKPREEVDDWWNEILLGHSDRSKRKNDGDFGEKEIHEDTPAPEPETDVLEPIAAFVRLAQRVGEKAIESVARFLREHPKVANFLRMLLVAGVVLAAILLAEALLALTPIAAPVGALVLVLLFLLRAVGPGHTKGAPEVAHARAAGVDLP